MKIAFQMDALEKLNMPFDTTLEVARPAAERGDTLFHYEPQHLRLLLDGAKVHIEARGHTLNYKSDAKAPWSLGEEQTHDLTSFDVILMRQDPPFDLAYVTATHILEQISKKVRIINDPVGVRNAPEKLLVTHFPKLMPPTLVTRDRRAIEDFRNAHHDIIFKPLYGYAGHGIFHLKPGDDNLAGLLETMATMNTEPWMIQKFLPVEKYGDKRIVLLDGEPVGCFTRMPAKGDMRGNMRVGAMPEKASLTKRDHDICQALAPTLQKEGLYLAGIDVIGDYVTEINVTSPTGLVVADKLEGRVGKDRIAEQFWQKLG